jgi:hypothetical protein
MDDVPLLSDRAYADLAVGDRWGPFTERLEAATSDALRGPVGETTAGGGAAAPLGVLPLLTLRVLRRALRGIIPGGVLARQSFALTDTLPARGDVAVGVAVTAQQHRPSGFYTTFTFTLAARDRTVAIVEWTILAPR